MKNLLAVAGVVAASFSAIAQAPNDGAVVRLDPALDAIVPSNAKVELLKEDYFGFTEGPVWDERGQYLLFSDMAANKIYKYTATGGFSVFLDPSGYTGDPRKAREAGQAVISNGRLFVGLLGSNGLALDSQGRLVLCARGDRAIVRIEKDGTRTTLADRFEGKPLNSPNDLAIRSDGSIYFSDVGNSTEGRPQREGSPPPSLYRLHNGVVQLLRTGFKDGNANGVVFSPDEQYLYVAAGKILRFPVRPDGSLGEETVFVADSGADGMKVDQKGNLYFGGPGGLWIVSPSGKHLGTIPMPRYTNLAFGDADRKTLYLTLVAGFGRIRLNIPGR